MTGLHLALAVIIPVVLFGAYRAWIAIRRRKIKESLEAMLREQNRQDR